MVSEGAADAPPEDFRRVALTARAPDSKSGGWGFESLHACQTQGERVRRDEQGNRNQPRDQRGGMEFVQRVQQFFREVAAEFRLVNWPNRAEVTRSTAVVL